MINKSVIGDLLNKKGMKGTIISSLVGFFISFIIVLIKGSGFPELIFRPFLSAVIMAVFWNLGYVLVQKMAPDFVKEMESAFSKSPNETFENYTPAETYGENKESYNFDLDDAGNIPGGESIGDQSMDSEKSSEAGEITESETQPSATTTKTTAKPKQRVGSDEILVQGVPIKKDPELMARTIQHVLDTDKE